MQIFFNDILVCTTADSALQVNSSGGFSINFSQIFSLNVVERLESICLKIRERFGTVNTSWYELGQIFIPVLDEFDNTHFSQQNLFNALTIKNDKGDLNQSVNIEEQIGFSAKESIKKHSSYELLTNESLMPIQFASDLVKARFSLLICIFLWGCKSFKKFIVIVTFYICLQKKSFFL